MNAAHVPDVDLNLLRVLAVMLEEKNTTRAAARLGMTQSAVSHALRRLRELLGDPLFVRSQRAMIPTARALRMGEPLEQLFADVSRVLQDERGFDPRTARRIFRIGAQDYAGFVLLPQLIARLEREAPGIDLVVRPPADHRFTDLIDGEVDLAIAVKKEGLAAIRTRRLFHERFVSLVREDHPTVKRKLTLERYLELSHVLVAPHGSRRGSVDDVLADIGHQRRVAVVVPHFLVAPMIVAETDMVLTIFERVARLLAKALPLRVVETPIELAGYDLHLYWHERDHRDAAHAWLRRTVAEVASKLKAT